MQIDEAEKIFSENGFIFFYVTPATFSLNILTRLLKELEYPDDAKKVIFYWQWSDNKGEAKLSQSQVKLMDGLCSIVNRMGGQWLPNWWEVENRAQRLHERE